MVVRFRHQLLFIGDAGVEDGIDPLVEEGADMPVHQLRRIADVLRGD